MESLNKISADKKAAVKQMGEVLDMMKTGSSTTSSNNNRSLHRGPPSSSNSSPSRRRTISTSSNNNTAMGESHLRKSVIHPNWNRRVSVSGDRPFFRRRATEAPPPLKDELAELRENFRRRSDPAQPDPSSFIPSRVLSRQSSKQGSMRSSIMNRSLSILNLNQNCNDGDSSSSSSSSNESDSQKNNHSNNGEDNDTTNQEEMIHYQTTLESKNQQLAQLQKQQVSNSNQQSYLQSKLQSIQTQSRSRLVQHTSIVEGLHSRKQTLAKTVQRRERLITEVEGCLEGYGERIDLLEKEIESKTNASQQKSVRHPLPQQDATDIRNSNNRKAMTVSDLEEEIRKYRMRQKIHSQYTAKALESFLNSMDMAKKKDTAGILFKNDQAKGEGSEEKRQHLIEGISLDVDIQLNNLERMIKEVAEKVKEYELLSSVDLDQVASSSSSLKGKDAVMDDQCVDLKCNISNSNGSSHPKHHNQLLSLSKECADLLADLLSTISKAMESTIRTTSPHSFSIEFQPTSSSSPTTFNHEHMHLHQNTKEEEEEELPYFQLQHKKLQLHTLKRSQLQVETNISLLQNESQKFQTGVHNEKMAHYEILANLQTKLRMLTERLEDGGEEIYGLVKELEEWKEREEGL